MNGRYLSSLLFVAVSGLGTLYLATEAVLQVFGKSICASDGCKVVAQYARYGDLSIVLAGAATLALLTLLSASGLRTVNDRRERLLTLVLVAALAAEGFFVGYQLFWLSTLCIFCLSVFGIFASLGILRIAAGHADALAGFGAMAVLPALLALLLPPGGAPLPAEGQYILFTSADCKHCAEIKKELEEKHIVFSNMPIREHAATLRNLGIVHVPTLLVNGSSEKVFLTGTDAIRRHLGCTPAASAASVQRPQKQKSASSPAAPPPSTGKIELFAPAGAQNPLFAPLPDDGLCKEDKKCD